MSVPADVELQRYITSLHIEEWLKDDFLYWRWWLLLVLVAAALGLWWHFADKERIHEITLFAALGCILSMGIFEYGEELVLWDFPTDLIPVFPPLSSFNLFSLPLAYSLLYQHFHSLKSFSWAALAASAFFCFAVEPLLVWGGFFEHIHWEYWYGLPLYAGAGLVNRGAVRFILRVVRKARMSF